MCRSTGAIPALAERLHPRIIRRSLHPAIPAPVVIRAVPVSFSVGFVVFEVIRNHVIEGKAVVAGDEVNALFRLPFLVAVKVRAPQESPREGTDGGLFPLSFTQ